MDDTERTTIEESLGDTDVSAEVSGIMDAVIEQGPVFHSSQLDVHGQVAAETLTPPAAIESLWANNPSTPSVKMVTSVSPRSDFRNSGSFDNLIESDLVNKQNDIIPLSTLSLESRTVGNGRNLSGVWHHSETSGGNFIYTGSMHKPFCYSTVLEKSPEIGSKECPKMVTKAVQTNGRYVRNFSTCHMREKSLSSPPSPKLPQAPYKTDEPHNALLSLCSYGNDRVSSTETSSEESPETKPVKHTKESNQLLLETSKTVVDDENLPSAVEPVNEHPELPKEMTEGDLVIPADSWERPVIENEAKDTGKTSKTTSTDLGFIEGCSAAIQHHLQTILASCSYKVDDHIAISCLKAIQWQMDAPLSPESNIWAPLQPLSEENSCQLWTYSEDVTLTSKIDCCSTERREPFHSFSLLCDDDTSEHEVNGPIINNLAGALQEGLAQYLTPNTPYRAPSLESLETLDRSSSSDEESDHGEYNESSDDDSTDSWDSGYFRRITYHQGRNEISSDADIDTDTDSEDESLTDDLRKLGFRDLDNRIQQMAVVWGYCSEQLGLDPDRVLEDELADPDLPGECLVHNILAVRRVSGLSRRP